MQKFPLKQSADASGSTPIDSGDVTCVAAVICVAMAAGGGAKPSSVSDMTARSARHDRCLLE